MKVYFFPYPERFFYFLTYIFAVLKFSQVVFIVVIKLLGLLFIISFIQAIGFFLRLRPLSSKLLSGQ